MDYQEFKTSILMTNNRKIYDKLEAECPVEYRPADILRFAYPFRKLKIKAVVNKSPDATMQQIYSVLLQSIKSGLTKNTELINFLGLYEDDFILQELYFLQQKGFIEFVAGEWLVSEQGNRFIANNEILQVLEEEDFEFLLDGITGEPLPIGKLHHNSSTKNKLSAVMNYSNRSPELLENKYEQLVDLYKSQSNNKSHLIDYNKNKILFDSREREDYFLVLYKPAIVTKDDLEDYIEVRSTEKDFTLNKRLSKIISELGDDVFADWQFD